MRDNATGIQTLWTSGLQRRAEHLAPKLHTWRPFIVGGDHGTTAKGQVSCVVLSSHGDQAWSSNSSEPGKERRVAIAEVISRRSVRHLGPPVGIAVTLSLAVTYSYWLSFLSGERSYHERASMSSKLSPKRCKPPDIGQSLLMYVLSVNYAMIHLAMHRMQQKHCLFSSVHISTIVQLLSH